MNFFFFGNVHAQPGAQLGRPASGSPASSMLDASMLRFVMIIAISLATSGCAIVRGAKTTEPTWFGFVEITKNIYVDKEMPLAQRNEVLKTVSAAKIRVSEFFGGLESQPKILACSTEKCFVPRIGGPSPKGMAYGSSALILSPRGLDVVIISHELTHIELHTRIGVFRSWRAIPSWFDEGLAVLVSQDPRYTEGAWLKATEDGRNVPDLNILTWGKGGWQLSYGTARHAVGEWYSHAGHTGLMLLISKVKRGESFDTALNNISSSTP